MGKARGGEEKDGVISVKKEMVNASNNNEEGKKDEELE